MNTDNCQHLTRYRLFTIMRIPICLLGLYSHGRQHGNGAGFSFRGIRGYRAYGRQHSLWQVSNQQGLGSVYDNTYIRGRLGYKHQLGKWKFEEKLDMVAAVGMNFKGDKDIFIQQAYIDARYKWLGLFAGSREKALRC